MRISLNKKAIVLVLSCLVIFTYVAFMLNVKGPINVISEKQSDEIILLRNKIDLISNQVKDSQSILLRMQSQFKDIASADEKEYFSKTVVVNHINKEPEDQTENNNIVIPIVVIAYNRPSVSRCLDLLFQYRTDLEPHFPIVVSQDGNHLETTKTIDTYENKLMHIRHPDEPVADIPQNHNNLKGYYKISSHYKWALNKVFQLYSDATAVIIVEDDLEVAPDFFHYFFYTYNILMQDESLYCVSAWNDNGKEGLINETANTLLYRTDFFPGLGWMLTKKLWNEMSSKWPKAFWDDWIRVPSQRLDRSCIRPELPRTKTFGRVGVSLGQFFDKHLKFIKLNSKWTNWNEISLDYLRKENYDQDFLQKVYSLPEVSFTDLSSGGKYNQVRLTYSTLPEYKQHAKSLKIMEDFKSGVPRTAYQGIVSVFFNNIRVYLAPAQPWKGYDESWN